MDILLVAERLIGDDHIPGSHVNYRSPVPANRWTSADLASWSAYQAYGLVFGCDPSGAPGTASPGAWRHDAQDRGVMVGVDEAIRTPGAILLRFSPEGPPEFGHVAISRGDGRTIEAAGQRRGVILGDAMGRRRWDAGVLLPTVAYASRDATRQHGAVLRVEPFPQPSPDVREIQLALMAAGFDPGPIDGLFGRRTEATVAAFQASKGLIVDGEAGPETRAALAAGRDEEAAGAGAASPAESASERPQSPSAPARTTDFQELRAEYRALFSSLVPAPGRHAAIQEATDRVLRSREPAERVGAQLGGAPWHAVALVAELQNGSHLDLHLHNGDPLTGRTVTAPRGRPLAGQPPFTWEESAVDALKLLGFAAPAPDWSLSRILHRLEALGGFGSRQHGVFAPHLWCGCQHYVSGAYGPDGWDPGAVSDRIGAAVILDALVRRGEVPPFSPEARRLL
ncbi:peptidoglycan-binding protein [Alsobacter sp. KACC 23698]|uniref:Peptidoglycan-binding protein n=1 Tax=Alsobacter sp. KACC 23698 TaxID=3149229 RepID=A0AAU7JBV4_9HYPH